MLDFVLSLTQIFQRRSFHANCGYPFLTPFQGLFSELFLVSNFGAHFRGCFWGAFLGPSSFDFLPREVRTFFQLVNHALEARGRGEPLLINMDESSIRMYPGRLTGAIAAKRGSDRVSLQDKRACFTYICSLSHDPSVQGTLPQIVLGNKRRLSTQLMREAARACPSLTLWRETSAWMTHSSTKRYINLLCQRLGDVIRSRSVYLILDLAPAHLHDSIFELAYKRGLRLLYIPPGLTSVLQPCDSHCFSGLKVAFSERWRQHRSRSAEGRVSPTDWLRAVGEAVEIAVQKDWRHAFESDGLLQSQQYVSQRLLELLEWTSPPDIPRGPPSLQPKWLFPRNWAGSPAQYVLWTPRAAYVRTLD